MADKLCYCRYKYDCVDRHWRLDGRRWGWIDGFCPHQTAAVV